MWRQMDRGQSTTTNLLLEPGAAERRMQDMSCPLCQCGIMNYHHVAQSRRHFMSLAEAQRVMFERGDIQFCECEHGVRRQLLMAKLSGRHVSDTEQRQSLEKLATAARRRRLFGEIEVPGKFNDYTVASYKQAAGKDKGKEKAIQAVEAYLDKGHVNTANGERYGLFFWGESDRGKTGLLCPMFLELLERRDASGLWIQYNELMAQMQNSSHESEEVQARINACKYVEYLFIDDFADPKAKWTSEKARDVMFRIIDHRSNYRTPTFITSNLRPEEVADLFHERMVKRIKELCAIVEVSGNPIGVLKK